MNRKRTGIFFCLVACICMSACQNNASDKRTGSSEAAPSTNENGLRDEYEAALSDWVEESVERQPADSHTRIGYTDTEVTITFDDQDEPTRKEMGINAYYIAGDTVRSCHVQANKARTDTTPFIIKLPEGGDRFIGAKVTLKNYFLIVDVDAAGKKRELESLTQSDYYIGRIRAKN